MHFTDTFTGLLFGLVVAVALRLWLVDRQVSSLNSQVAQLRAEIHRIKSQAGKAK